MLLFAGGEPFVRPDLYDLGRRAIEHGIRAVISTNGTLITEEVAVRVKEVGFSYVGVSLDGGRTTNDRFRGLPGAFDAALEGIRNCHSAGVKAGLRFTVNKRNVDDLPEILDVVEAGDAYLDHTGRFVEGQQLTMFGVTAPVAMSDAVQAPKVEVVDLAAEMQDAVEYCKSWTNRAAKERAQRQGPGENHHAALNLAYGRTAGRKGSLSTPSEYRAKGDWMKRRYLELMK